MKIVFKRKLIKNNKNYSIFIYAIKYIIFFLLKFKKLLLFNKY